MKYLPIRFVLVALGLLAFGSPALANPVSSRFDGGYFGTNKSGPISEAEVTVSGSRIYGTVFLRGIDTYDFLFFDDLFVDRAGNIRGTFSNYINIERPFFGHDGGAFAGKVTGGVLILTFQSGQVTAKVKLIKASGFAPPFIAGRHVYAKGLALYFDEKKVWIEQEGERYMPYSYRKTGRNTGVVLIPGIGVVQLTFDNRWEGRIMGLGIDTSFVSSDYDDPI